MLLGGAPCSQDPVPRAAICASLTARTVSARIDFGTVAFRKGVSLRAFP